MKRSVIKDVNGNTYEQLIPANDADLAEIKWLQEKYGIDLRDSFASMLSDEPAKVKAGAKAQNKK